jgi:hypothetical protein
MRLGRGHIVVVLALALLVAAAAAQARAPRFVDAGGRTMHGRYASWLRAARIPLAPGRLQLVIGSCPGHPQLEACVISRNPRRVYITRRARLPRMVLYHELGHVYDMLVLHGAERSEFRRLLHIGHRGWFRGSVPPAELFADAYARCARYGPNHSGGRFANPTRSVYGYRPTLRQHRAVCRLIARAATPKRRPQPPPRPPPVFGPPPPSAPAPDQPSKPSKPPPEQESPGPTDLLFGPLPKP